MMTCADVMTPTPTCCQPGDTIEKVAEMMKRENIGLIPVVGDQAALVGVLTDRDIVLNVVAEGRDPRQTCVADVMTHDPRSCRAEEPADTVMELMASRQIRRVPIVGDHGEIVGIIAQADIATRLAAPEQTGQVVEAISEPTLAS
jgi:CBS domain-containing protein